MLGISSASIIVTDSKSISAFMYWHERNFTLYIHQKLRDDTILYQKMQFLLS